MNFRTVFRDDMMEWASLKSELAHPITFLLFLVQAEMVLAFALFSEVTIWVKLSLKEIV